jgi:hypothetical protein
MVATVPEIMRRTKFSKARLARFALLELASCAAFSQLRQERITLGKGAGSGGVDRPVIRGETDLTQPKIHEDKKRQSPKG